MTPDQERRLFSLFQGHSQDSLMEAEHRELQSLLRADSEARRLWFVHQDIELGLRSGLLQGRVRLAATAASAASAAPTPTGARSQWLGWRSIAAAAAGLVIGAFSATAAWAFAAVGSPRGSERAMPLVDGSFEQVAQVTVSRPLLKNGWHGDPAEVVGVVGRVAPHGGARMLRFAASAIAEDEREKREAADMWQILEVPQGGPHQVRVRAWFAADAAADTSFVVMATAMACGLDEVASAWSARFDGDPRVLSASVKTTIVRGADASWHLCEVLLDVPQGSRLLVLDVAGRKLPGQPAAQAFPAQFVDDVSVSIADEPALP